MIEQINNFANFNLSAILFAVIGGGVFIAVFHYALLPILNILAQEVSSSFATPKSIGNAG